MILRSEKEVSPCSINDNGGSSSTLKTCEIQKAYAELRGRSLRLIIKLKKGEYFPASTLKFDGNVCLTSLDANHQGTFVHGQGDGAVIEANKGATVVIDRVSILQYAAYLPGNDYVSGGTDMHASMCPSCVETGPETKVIVNKCFLHCRSGSTVVSKGSGSSVQVNKAEMHGCSYAGAWSCSF